MLAAALLAWTLLGADSDAVLAVAAFAGAPGLVLLALALTLGWPVLVPWSVVCLGAAYAVSLRGLDSIDSRAPVVGALLVLVAELAYWSVERRTPIGDEAGLHARRGLVVLTTTAAAAAIGAALLLATSVPLGGSVAWDTVGLVAAAGAVAILALLARRV